MEYVSHPWINEGTIEKRAYQEMIVQSAVDKNTLVCIPTGLGKTSIAAMVAAECLRRDMHKKILVMAPTRPLVNQHMKSFARFLKVGESELKVVTGGTNPEERVELYRKADIIFSTPQTIRNDLKKDRIHLGNFSLCIFDEAHRAVGEYAYPYVAKCYRYHCKSPLILALTASPGSYAAKINEVRDKLFIENVEIRTREDEDVKPYVQDVQKQWVEVELPIAMKSIKGYLEKCREERIKKLMDWRVIHHPMIAKHRILELQQELAKKRTGIGYAAMSLLAQVIKIDHSLGLLETQCLYSLKAYFDQLANRINETRAVVRLMNDVNFKNAMRLTLELIKEGQEHPKLEKLKEIISNELKNNKFSQIMVFAQYRDTISKIREMLETVPKAAPIEFVGQAKKKGKGLSQKEQMQILNEFKLGFYNILIASQIGEEGLDIEETDAVIFYEPVPSAVRRIQRAGRTARTRAGKVIMLITKDTRDQAYHWSGRHKEQRMMNILYGIQKGQKSMADFRK